MKHLALIAFFTASAFMLNAQNYTREAGIRGGLTSGFTYRQYLSPYLSYQGILSFRQGGSQLTILRQIHEPEPNEFIENLFLVYGFGLHAGFYFTDKYRSIWNYDYYYSHQVFSPVFGINGYIGAEYLFVTVPLIFGVNYKPYFEFSSRQFFDMRLWDLAFSVSYRF